MFKLLEAKPSGQVRYEADFWEGPLRSGDKGRYVRTVCEDIYSGGRFRNTSPSVSYYSQLLNAVRKKV